MVRLVLFLVLCAMVLILSACGTNHAATSSAPAADSAKAQNESAQTINVPVGKDGRTNNLVFEEKTAGNLKFANYYAYKISELYLKNWGDAVEKPDGFLLVAKYLDADSSTYQSEKKYIEDSFAQGIRYKLVDYRLSADAAAYRVLEERPKYVVKERKVNAECTYETIYSDNRKKTEKMCKVFTIREEWDHGVTGASDVGTRITVAITHIDSRPSTGGDSAGKVQWPKKFEALEKTAYEVKAENYYIDLMPELYLRSLKDAIERPEGFLRVAGYLDADRPIYQSEKKYVEECIAQGTKLRLIAFSMLGNDGVKGRALDPKGHMSEHKVTVEYSYEYTFADNRKETQKMQKVFTMRKEWESGTDTSDYLKKITVVITNIEDAAADK